ncbi:CotO family spore coat protein [Niallia sp. NCCP-28]|uniref:CotO family spore coat protein n=1 Tax=Niallia sp. NCCP-28 TaxID=2934712 RepID=UPI002086E72D|nr:CotO family spore coat protein [Niallia sp. NCCP-28]GKU81818.1 hypothetical protein NCCP28_12140 [Niallia sp. NCCP-28]
MPKKKIEDKNSPAFIQKPNPSIVNNTMQKTFSSKKFKEEKQKANLESKKREEQLQQLEKQKKILEKAIQVPTEKFTDSNSLDVQKQIIEYNESQGKEEKQHKQSAFKRLKSFKEMSIDEKLIYLLNFPKQLPPVPCIVITENQNVRGFVLEKDDNYVQLKLMNESVMKISLAKIQEVKMIGL